MPRETAAEKAEREAAEAALNPTPQEGEPNHTEDKGKFVKFTGHNGVRSISTEEWAAVMVEDQEGKTWDRTNAYRVPKKEFGEKALNYLLNVDGEFVLED